MKARSKKKIEKRHSNCFDLKLTTKAENNNDLKLKIEKIEKSIFEEIKRMIEVYKSESKGN